MCVNKIYGIHYETLYSDSGRQPGNKTTRYSVPSGHHTHLYSHTHTHTHSSSLLLLLVPSVHSESPGIDPGLAAATAKRVCGDKQREGVGVR